MGCCGVSVKDERPKPSINIYPKVNQANPEYLNNPSRNPKITQNNLEISNITKDKNSTEFNNQERRTEKNNLRENTKRNSTIRESSKPIKNITILENVKEYLPEDITMEEIEEMVFNALGNYIVDKSQYKKGTNLTEEQAIILCELLYNYINETNDETINKEILDNIKLKMGFCDVNRDNIKNIMFRGQNPSEDEIEDVLIQFRESVNPKLFVIELLE